MLCSRKNFKSLFHAGIVGVSNLHIPSNENDWCHSARVTSPGNIKGHANHSRSLFASSLASRTDHLFPLSPQSSPPSIMRRAHPIYGPLVILENHSFIIHLSFETNGSSEKQILNFNSCFDFSILIPVLTTASQLLLWLQHFNSCLDESISTPALTSASLFLLNSTTDYFYLRLTAQGFLFVPSCYKNFQIENYQYLR